MLARPPGPRPRPEPVDPLSPVARDPLTGIPSLVAPGRAARPHDLSDNGPRSRACPFCPGNESATPPATSVVTGPGGAWRVRAFANLYPAVPADEGVHEVVVNGPRHVTRLDELDADEAGAAGELWAARLAAVRDDPRALWPLGFVNQGAMAGASLAHTHAQIVGLPVAAPNLDARARALAGDPALLQRDWEEHARVILRRDGLVMWSPSVPTLSGAVRIAPETPAGVPAPGAARALGRLVARAAGAVRAVSGVDDLNVCLFVAGPGDTASYHWHADIFPRRGTLAGLELGSGALTMTRMPEEVAGAIRAAVA